ncbi:MAG: hypothetical protein ACRDDW_07140 [Candidatus Rhabdochlamydia sp.]
MRLFSIENYISQQIRNSFKRTNNLFTQFQLKNIWETTVSNQSYLKRPLAFFYYWKKRKQVLKKSKKINKIFLFSIKTVIKAAHERWPLDLSPDYMYNSLFMTIPPSKRGRKEEFYSLLEEKEEKYQRAANLFFEGLQAHFFYLVPREMESPELKRIFFDEALRFLQDPKMQKSAIRTSTRKSQSYFLATHKIKDLKKTFYQMDREIKEEAEIDSFKDAA